MTAWEQFVLVVITLGGVTAPFILIIVFSLKYSRETFEVVHKATTLRCTPRNYFLSFDLLFAAAFALAGTVLLVLLFTAKVSESILLTLFLYLLFVILIGMMLFFAGYIIYLYANYWPYTKNMEISFNPEPRTVTVRTEDQEFILNDGDIYLVEEYTNDHLKFPFSYYRFYIHNQPPLIITSMMPGVMGIFEYFKKAPLHRHIQLVPAIH